MIEGYWELIKTFRERYDGNYMAQITEYTYLCLVCNGTGRVDDILCPQCEGEGKVTVQE